MAKTNIIFLKKKIFLEKDKIKFWVNNKFNNKLIHIIRSNKKYLFFNHLKSLLQILVIKKKIIIKISIVADTPLLINRPIGSVIIKNREILSK